MQTRKPVGPQAPGPTRGQPSPPSGGAHHPARHEATAPPCSHHSAAAPPCSRRVAAGAWAHWACLQPPRAYLSSVGVLGAGSGRAGPVPSRRACLLERAPGPKSVYPGSFRLLPTPRVLATLLLHTGPLNRGIIATHTLLPPLTRRAAAPILRLSRLSTPLPGPGPLPVPGLSTPPPREPAASPLPCWRWRRRVEHLRTLTPPDAEEDVGGESGTLPEVLRQVGEGRSGHRGGDARGRGGVGQAQQEVLNAREIHRRCWQRHSGGCSAGVGP